MADEPIEANNEVESQPEVVPASNQTLDNEVSTEAAPSQEVSQSTEADEFSLPDGSNPRTTQQFDKLKSANRDLRVELTSMKQKLEELEQVRMDRESESTPVTPIYDPETGLVDVNAIESIRSQNEALKKEVAKTSNQFTKYMQQQSEKEAFAAHPELNSDSKEFDQDFFNLTRALINDSTNNPRDYGGKALSAKEAADRAKAFRMESMETIKKEVAKQAVEELTPKEQASLEATGRSDRRNSTGDLTELRQRSRRGDKGAIIERLKNLG